MDIRLIAMDLDGTLNNDQKQITPRTLSALMEAQHKGIRLALASARPSPGLFKERDILQMRQFGGILMSYNGGRIVDAATGETLFETAMELNQAKAVLHRLKQLPVTPILDDGMQFYVSSLSGYKVDYECKNNRMEATAVDDLEAFLSFRPVKILMSVLPEEIRQVQEAIRAFLPEDLHVVQTAPFYLEVIPKTIHKGQGITQICKALGLNTNQVIAFGDAENDIPMLKAAGIGVSMGNAADHVKEAADYVTATNNDDGIAAALSHFAII